MKTALAVLSAALALTACSRGSDADRASGGKADAHPAQRTVAERGACPFATFDAFLERFMADEATQRVFVRTPLVQTHLETTAAPEPRTVAGATPAELLSFPLIPTREALSAQGRVVTVGGAPDRPEVKIAVPDSDAQVRYVFERTDCWRLAAIHDESL